MFLCLNILYSESQYLFDNESLLVPSQILYSLKIFVKEKWVFTPTQTLKYLKHHEDDGQLPNLYVVFCSKTDLIEISPKKYRTDCATWAKSRLSDGHVWQYPQCKKIFSVRAGTIFMGSKFTLKTVFSLLSVGRVVPLRLLH